MARLKHTCNRCLWALLYIIPIVLGISYVASDQAKKMAIEALNEELNVRVDIHNVHISGISTFPNVGIDLVNLRVQESQDMFTGDLVRASEVRLEFDILDLIKGKNEISQILIRNGKVQIYEDSKGGNNFRIFKPSEEESDDSPINLNLKKVRLQNCMVVYRNDDNSDYYSIRANDLTASAKFVRSRMDLRLKGDGYIQQSISAGNPILVGKNFNLDVDLSTRQDIQSYKIKRGYVGIEKLEMNVEGDILMLRDIPDLDLKLSGKNVNIGDVVSVLPYEVSESMGDWDSDGNLQVNGFVKGMISEHDFPTVNIDFGIKDGAAFSESSGVDIRSLTAKGVLKNSSIDRKDLSLDLDIDNLKMPNTHLKGKLNIKGFASPGMDIDLNGFIGLEDLNGMVEHEAVRKLAGKGKINIRGKVPWNKKLNDFDYERISLRGDVDLRNATIDLVDYPINDLNLAGNIGGNKIDDVRLSFKMYDNDVFYEGTANQWVGFVFSDKRLQLNGNLASQKLDLDQILAGDHPEENASSDTTPSAVSIDLGIDARVSASVQDFTWLGMNMDEVQGDLTFTEDMISTELLRLNCFKGKAELQGLVRTKGTGFYVDSRLKTKDVYITSLFEEFDNFGQDEITEEHLSGLLTSDIDMRFETDSTFTPISSTFYALTDLHISQGRLKGYKPLESLSSFVEVSELMDIAFDDLVNTIEIKNELIIIPHMNVRSTAMNLEISGTHSFDNFMDYKIKVSLTELLASKSGWIRKKREKKLEEGENGGLAAYVIMRGTPDDLKLSYDKDAVKEKIKEEAKRERQQFYVDLKKELRGERVTTSKEKKVRWAE